MMETIPSGKQHKIVDKIAHTDQLSGLGLLMTGGWGGVGGNGGGVEVAEITYPHKSKTKE